MNHATTQDEKVNEFIEKWKRQKAYGWSALKWGITTLVLGGIFAICVWTTTGQTGLMPGGSISGAANQVIQGLDEIK